jgi:hypothetical protein
MASLTIPFPEGTRKIVLRGDRITIGRLPDNTIQIRDRTISAYHAELLTDGDHYRLHDKGSTNGIVVGGQRVQDFHLREDCKVNFGGVVCEFSAAEVPESAADGSSIPTRSEMLTIQQNNSDLRGEVAALREQVETMKKAREADGENAQKELLAKQDQLASEIAQLRGTLQERQTQIERLNSLLAIMTRERDTLQRGYDDAKAALERAKQSQATEPAETSEAGKPSAEPAAPVSPPLARLAPQPPSPTGAGTAAPKVPAAPAMPGAPRPGVVPAPNAGNGAKSPAAPAVPAAGSNGNGSSPSLPKPPASLPGAGSTPVRRPASAVQAPAARPATAQPAAAKPAVGAAARLVGAGAPGAGKGTGTQKLSE